MQLQAKHYLLIIGNARSGSTLLGSVIDAHPNALVANESVSSSNFWRGLSRTEILEDIRINSLSNRESGRLSEGYSYYIEKADTSRPITLIGDKIWNPATLLLHGDHKLINRLEETLDLPLKIIHAVRNPYDVIATMQKRSTAPIGDRIRWYFMHCDAVAAIQSRLPADRFIVSYHEDLIRRLDISLHNISDFLELPYEHAHAQACRNLIFENPNQSRSTVHYSREESQLIIDGMKRFDFLSRYISSDC